MWTAEKRQRVSHACDECKRKKKQCSGTSPCTTCNSRSFRCTFSNATHSEDRQRTVAESDQKSAKRKFGSLQHPQIGGCDDLRLPTAAGPPKDPSTGDETPIENPGRLLQDGKGRLLYLGDSATLSFLQSIRSLVASTLGPSPFTMDSSRHKILEATISIPPSYQHNYALPDLEAAQFLVDSFFANTTGLVDIFDKATFTRKVEETYENPLDANSQWLCHLNLVFAIGLRLRKDITALTPVQVAIVQRLENGSVNRDEIFYATAKQLRDPVAGFEDGGIAVAQSLLLMTIYMLACSKRNTAWGYLGMAVNLAYALGIHKEETLVVFNASEQVARRNLWKSLYILDCFLAASLGRPNSISCVSASDLCPLSSIDRPNSVMPLEGNELSFSVNASKIIGDILSRIYHRRKASRSVAYILSLRLSDWMKELPEELHWRRMSAPNEAQDMMLKRLHINLIYFHGILLLTRPFLLHQISKQLDETAGGSSLYGPEQQKLPSYVDAGRPEQNFCFHGACVRSAMHTINGVYTVYSTSALPRRDPFVIYWLFSAALIILANIFCPVHVERDGDAAVQKALTVMAFCGGTDPQARRYQTIIEAFYEVLAAEATKKVNAQGTGGVSGARSIFSVLFGAEDAGVAVDDDAQIWGAGVPLMSHGSRTASARRVEAQQVDPNGLDALCFLAGLDATGNERWMNGVAGPNEMTDIDRTWWTEAQEAFISTGDMQVPLYGLMEPT